MWFPPCTCKSGMLDEGLYRQDPSISLWSSGAGTTKFWGLRPKGLIPFTKFKASGADMYGNLTHWILPFLVQVRSHVHRKLEVWLTLGKFLCKFLKHLRRTVSELHRDMPALGSCIDHIQSYHKCEWSGLLGDIGGYSLFDGSYIP